MPQYHAAYLTGEQISIADTQTLQAFQQVPNHHPLQDEQILYAGKQCFVREIGIWHGGDCLYSLSTYVKNSPTSRHSHKEEVPGLWHEDCLRDQDLRAWNIPLPKANDVYSVVAEMRDNQPVVVVRTVEGVECLVIRHLQNENESALMTLVAGLRNTLSFEWRYRFQGVAHDAMHRRELERQDKKD